MLKNKVRRLLYSLLVGLGCVVESVSACLVHMNLPAMTSGLPADAPARELEFTYELTDVNSLRLFPALLRGRKERFEEPWRNARMGGGRPVRVASIRIECSDEERRWCDGDRQFQGELFAILAGFADLEQFTLNNLGGLWVVERLAGMDADWMQHFHTVQLLNLKLPEQPAVLGEFLDRLPPLAGLTIPCAGLTDFGPIARCLRRGPQRFMSLIAHGNNFKGQETGIKRALAECPNLGMLDLSGCQLCQFPLPDKPKKGRTWTKLQLLRLAENDFSSCCVEDLENVFQGLVALQELAIDSCNFSNPRFLNRLLKPEQLILSCSGKNFEGRVEEFITDCVGPRKFKGIIGIPMMGWVGTQAKATLLHMDCLQYIPAADIEELDLEGSNFSVAWGLLPERLNKFTKLEKLSLRNCRLQNAHAISVVCQERPPLKELDLRQNLFDSRVLLLELSFLPPFQRPHDIHLDCIDEKRGLATFDRLDHWSTFPAIAALPAQSLARVRELQLRQCSFRDGRSDQFGKVFIKLPAMKTLRIIDSTLNVAALVGSVRDTVEAIDLSGCSLRGQEEALGDLLSQTHDLRSLSLVSCDLLSCQFLERLPQAVLVRLTQLDLSGNDLDAPSVERLRRMVLDCTALTEYADQSMELRTEKKRTIMIVREELLQELSKVLEGLPAAWRERVTEVHLPAVGQEFLQAGFGEAVLRSFERQLRAVWVRGADGMIKVPVLKLRELIDPPTGSSEMTDLAGIAGTSAIDGAALVTSGSDDGDSAETDSEDEALQGLSEVFSRLSVVGARSSAAASRRPAKKPVRSSAAASGSVVETAAAASSSASAGVACTEDVYIFHHPGQGELVLKSCAWREACGIKNYDASRLPTDAVVVHCSGDGVDQRVRFNLGESYNDDPHQNAKRDLAHAFDAGAIDWIMRHPDARTFVFRGGGTNKLKTSADLKIAFMLPILLSWTGKDRRVMTKECFAVVSFGRDGVLYHACYHGGVDFHRYSCVRRGEVHIRFDEGSGRLSFDLEGLWGV